MTRKQIKEQAARYAKFVEWSDEDQCFIGRCPEIMGGGVHGSDEARVYKELCETVEEWIELLQKDGVPLPEPLAGKKFSGRFVLRVEPALQPRPSPPEKASTATAPRSSARRNEHCAPGVSALRCLFLALPQAPGATKAGRGSLRVD